MTDVSVFYNACDLPGSRDLMLEQMIRFCKSDLSQSAANVYIMMNGDLTKFLDLAQLLTNNTNVRMVHTATTSNLMEWPGLTFLKDFCDQQTAEHHVMYFHAKGVSRLNNPGIRDWRRYLEYWTIDRWKDSVAKLDQGFDTVGTNFINQPFLGADLKPRDWNHYSGNFWWARSSYIKQLEKLPHPDSYVPGTESKLTGYPIDQNNHYRFDHEAWIASGRPKWYEIDRTPGGNHNNEIGSYPGWHYHYQYPESMYK